MFVKGNVGKRVDGMVYVDKLRLSRCDSKVVSGVESVLNCISVARVGILFSVARTSPFAMRANLQLKEFSMGGVLGLSVVPVRGAVGASAI